MTLGTRHLAHFRQSASFDYTSTTFDNASSRKEDIDYDAVKGTIERGIHIGVNWDEFSELGVIGIDEIALTKGRRNFVAIISTQQADGRVAVLAVLPNRKKKTVRQFLESIPKRPRRTVKTACTDMCEGYVNAVKEFAAAHPEVSIDVVVDRYHVATNYCQCVDKVRKRERRRLEKTLPATEYQESVKDTMWIVRKNNQDLTDDERKRLRRLFEYSPDLKMAYTFREELTAICELPLTKAQAKRRLIRLPP